ncbi:hypothetical protein Nepgr_021935 [Nepenthes gracilis]|uniref:Uncharacterized protein n=1 Tax=Nepenthes gracilis TaxID=150966 RepID=A0AAD3SZI0_NEPGR|nr:hypothetical protein Nepgr_021935 [Nepenthes gracilis]
MPGLAQRNDQLSNETSSYYSLSSTNGSVSSNGFWSKQRDGITYNQLQKFWSELSPQARQGFLRVDKQTLFEQARKNMYCPRCNGLLLEGFLQIQLPCTRQSTDNQIIDGSSETSVCQDEPPDPSVHPWGGLTTTKDGALTLLDCYLYSRCLKGLQKVFDSARTRERERELLYPDACGGGGRGWISQGMASYGRGHGTRETCALHTARLSCDTLVDFWLALGEETRQSLLRMKEEDFIEKLMYRFDSKRFCRDCRKNVIREFRELKELKRMWREPRCTSYFCVADTYFQYEVSNDAIHADWHQTFIDSVGTYHHFEWAVGTGEGKSDILDFENVGLNGRVQVNGLKLGSLNACYITLRAWKQDGRCTEHSVKAYALKGQQCVHRRLIVGDGSVAITCGESIRKFFEHAEEVEEEEDDDSMDKDGNDLDGECSRPQKHAKSPELAREFLLDAATVIFKEQVEKAFREGTARQNAHSIFVCLALKLLEERVHVACKEILTLEKQMKLLEEEEKEKREEEVRKERKRTKEREKKLRRKDRLRGKEKEKNCAESNQTSILSHVSEDTSSLCDNEEPSSTIGDLVNETGGATIPTTASADEQDPLSSNDYTALDLQNNTYDSSELELTAMKTGNGSFTIENSKVSRRKLKTQKEFELDSSTKLPNRRRNVESRYYGDISDSCSRGVNALNRQPRANAAKFNPRNGGLKFNQKLQLCSNRNDLQSCGCNLQNDYRAKAEPNETKTFNKLESGSDLSKPVHRTSKSSLTDYLRDRDNWGRPRTKISNYCSFSRDLTHTKKVWEPVEPQKRYPRSNSDTDISTLRRSSALKAEGIEAAKSTAEICSAEVSEKLLSDSRSTSHGGEQSFKNGFEMEETALDHSKEAADEEVDSCLTSICNSNGNNDFSSCSSSSSDNCSSWISEGDNNTSSSNLQNLESSSISGSEDGSQQLEGRETSICVQNDREVDRQKTREVNGDEAASRMTTSSLSYENAGSNTSLNSVAKASSQVTQNGKLAASVGSLQQRVLPQIHNQNIHFPIFQAPTTTLGYYQQNPISWPTAPARGLMQHPHPSHYLISSPFGYGLNGDSQICMQYGPIQHPASPLAKPSQIPANRPVPKANDFNTREETIVSEVTGVRDHSGESMKEKVVPTGRRPTGAPPSSDVQNGKSTGSHTGNTGFSLFQFGGPLALSTYKSNLHSSNEALTGDIYPNFSEKETAIEEYNLFAESNGIKFSIF